MLFKSGNPYKGDLPEFITLSPEDFVFQISPLNLNAVDHVAKWTVLVYMAADCNLAEPMFDNLLQMKQIGSNQDLNICVLFDGPLLTDSFFARLNKDTSLEEDIVFRFLDVHSDDPKVLRQTITSTVAMYPAERKLLILSGHGFGWQGALPDDSTWKKYKTEEKIVLPIGGIEPYHKQLSDCYHKTMADVRMRFNPDDMHRGAQFDILSLDACNMGNIETLNHLIEFSNIIIASEISVPGGGYPYDNILKKLTIDPSLDCREISKHIVNETSKYYAHSHELSSDTLITQAAFDCHKFPDLFDKIADLAKQMAVHINQQVVETIKSCIQDTYSFDGGYIDLKGLAQNLSEAQLPIEVKKAAEVLNDFLDDSGFVLESDVPGGRYMPNGLSIYAPSPENFNLKYIKILNSLSSSLMQWGLFLGAYYIGILGQDAIKHPLVSSIARQYRQQP